MEMKTARKKAAHIISLSDMSIAGVSKLMLVVAPSVFLNTMGTDVIVRVI